MICLPRVYFRAFRGDHTVYTPLSVGIPNSYSLIGANWLRVHLPNMLPKTKDFAQFCLKVTPPPGFLSQGSILRHWTPATPVRVTETRQGRFCGPKLTETSLSSATHANKLPGENNKCLLRLINDFKMFDIILYMYGK